MRKQESRIILLVLLSTIILCPIIATSAKKPEGPSYVTTDTLVWDPSGNEQLPNGNVKIGWTVNAHWHGDGWDGIAVQYIKGIARTDEKGNGLWTAYGWGVFTGTIDGKSGEIYYRIRNNILFEPFRFFGDHLSIWKGTGDFENIHGYGILNFATNQAEMYIHFDP